MLVTDVPHLPWKPSMQRRMQQWYGYLCTLKFWEPDAFNSNPHFRIGLHTLIKKQCGAEAAVSIVTSQKVPSWICYFAWNSASYIYSFPGGIGSKLIF